MSNSTPSSSSTPTSPGKRPFTRRAFGRIIVSIAALATLIGIFYAEEDWRGKHAWNKYRAAAEARGVNLDWSKFIPPAVPDAQNFAMTPFLAPLFDFNPEPRKPGQSRWRDDAGAKRAQDFANEINSLFSTPGARPLSGRMTDLNAAVRFIQKKAKPPIADPPTRAAAATSMLATLAQFKPVLDELREASHRPFSRFNISYNDEDPASILLPHLGVLKSAATMLFWRASAELELKQTDAALADVGLIIYLGNAVQGEPFHFSLLIRISCCQMAEQIIWEGLAGHLWTDAELREFQTSLGGLNFPANLLHALDAERASVGVRTFELIRRQPGYLEKIGIYNDPAQAALPFVPAGWVYYEQIDFQRFFDERILPGLDAPAAQIHPRVIDENLLPNAYSGSELTDPHLAGENPVTPAKSPDGPFARLLHHTVLRPLLVGSAHNWFRTPARGQTAADQTVIACALERYRLANGKLPDTLEPLVPQFLARVPHDVCTGDPMKYRRNNETEFALYSVGWNEKDDGGTFVPVGTLLPNEGDWVWPPYSVK